MWDMIFACRYPIAPAPFLQPPVLPLNCFHSFVKNQLHTSVWAYFCSPFCSINLFLSLHQYDTIKPEILVLPSYLDYSIFFKLDYSSFSPWHCQHLLSTNALSINNLFHLPPEFKPLSFPFNSNISVQTLIWLFYYHITPPPLGVLIWTSLIHWWLIMDSTIIQRILIPLTLFFTLPRDFINFTHHVILHGKVK